MHHFLPYRILDNNFLLSSCKTAFWEEEKALICSDLHLGKTGHFRKSGIAVPQTVLKEDLQRLFSAIQFYKAEQVIIVGDLFHSDMNLEHDLFLRWRESIPHIAFHLVKGNHDILKHTWYEQAKIEIHKKNLRRGKFVFTHDINHCETGEEHYCFSGHIHPGVTLSGLGRQSASMPCFFFRKEYAILPAFGKFTGIYPMKPAATDDVFLLFENRIMKL